jgi:hypothetical protein
MIDEFETENVNIVDNVVITHTSSITPQMLRNQELQTVLNPIGTSL